MRLKIVARNGLENGPAAGGAREMTHAGSLTGVLAAT
jgi:hypothetical protein